MLFDWFTVFAQIANFLILMWLLKRFLYKPILDAIDAREKRIADLLTETEQSQQAMEQQQAELTAKNTAFAAEREGLLMQAKADAEQLKQQLLSAASGDVAAQRNKWLAGLQKEQVNLQHDINKRTQKAVFDVARKTLQDLSNVELEGQIIQVFIKQLEQLSDKQRQQFSNSAADDLLICTATSLHDDSKKILQEAIVKILSTHAQIHFKTDIGLLSGIEMTGNGQKVSWNINDYLNNLEASISQLVSSKVDSQRVSVGDGEQNVTCK